MNIFWTTKKKVHIYNEILFSQKKERIWVGSSEVDGPKACYTEWSKSEREKQILYINPYMGTTEDKMAGCITDSMDMSVGKLRELVMDREACTVIHGVAKSRTRLRLNWLNPYIWNLEKWYWWSDLQGRNRDSDTETRPVDSRGRRGWEELRATVKYVH